MEKQRAGTRDAERHQETKKAGRRKERKMCEDLNNGDLSVRN